MRPLGSGGTVGSLGNAVEGNMAVAVVLLATCVLIEHVAPIDRFSLRQRIPGTLMTFTGALLGTLLIWPVQQLWKLVDPSLVIPLARWLAPLGLFGFAVQFLIVIVVTDFLRYWRHRAEHKWFWPIHAVHHAPTELHAANDLGHPLQVIPEFLLVTIPVSLIGMSSIYVPLSVGLVMSFLSVYIHSPIDFHFGAVRRIIVDNRFHRLHHSLETRHIDTNFGICFSMWDAMFGTAVWPYNGEWPAVGVRDVPAPRNLREYLVLPFRLWRETLVRVPKREIGGEAPLPR